MQDIKYSIVVPAYNEEEVIDTSYARLKEVMDQTDGTYELIFINDGSADKTYEMLERIAENDSNVRVINFAKNFGHQLAVSAGLDRAVGDAVVVIDADLQDPPEVMLEMIKLWKEGYDVVYGKRKKRQGETIFKKFTAFAYYRILKSMSGMDMPLDAGDFRLMDRKVVDVMVSMREHNRYLRGMASWVGFKQTPYEFERNERFAGVTKYSLKKMLELAGNGIFSFSSKPMTLSIHVGLFTGFLTVVWMILYAIFAGIKGTFSWMAMAVGGIYAMISLVLIAIGFCGVYLGRIYDEAKDRPLYLVANTLGYEEDKQSDR